MVYTLQTYGLSHTNTTAFLFAHTHQKKSPTEYLLSQLCALSLIYENQFRLTIPIIYLAVSLKNHIFAEANLII